MSKVKEKVGIDVSKSTLDVYSGLHGSKQYLNTPQGFNEMINEFGEDSHFVMEFTGAYHYQLALYLHEKVVSVSVVNPLVIKRFMQMKLQRNKTDKSDAQMIIKETSVDSSRQ